LYAIAETERFYRKSAGSRKLKNKKRLNSSYNFEKLGPTLILTLALLFSGCSKNERSMHAPSVMNPAGPAADSIARLSWVFFILGGFIFVGVIAYLIYALVRTRSPLRNDRSGTRVVIFGGMIFPAVVLLILFILNTNVLGEVSTPDESQANLVIEVTGRQWWWEVHYANFEFATANEIHIPVGKPVLLKLRAEDVIHSFWVPELHGKMDMIPGRVNDFWIQADKEGTYRGECAEYCGRQHARMQFLVVAESEIAFQDWATRMQQPLKPNDAAVQKGLEVFLSSTCVQCHAIEGTNATGEFGPDLTHLGSRQTIGAGTLPLTRANLGGWIANAQGVKPGAHMPPSSLNGAELTALIDFLMALK
jgi:cytochrome c oxidase subunit II